MSEREPGRLLCDLYRFAEYWARLDAWQKENFARVESAIRADERALLQAEVDRLREALREIAGARPRCCEISDAMQYIARAALKEEKP